MQFGRSNLVTRLRFRYSEVLSIADFHKKLDIGKYIYNMLVL